MSLLQFFTSQAAPWKRLVAPPIFPAPMEWHWAPRCGRPERGWTDKGMESTYVQRHPKLTEFDLLWFIFFVKSINLIYAKKLYETTMKDQIFATPPERESDLRNFPRCYQREKDWWRQQRSAGCQPWRLQNDSSDLHSQRARKMLAKTVMNDKWMIQTSAFCLRSDISDS